MWLKAFVLLIAAMMLPGTALAQAETRYDPYGSRGDAGVDLRCSAGSYVVGMAGAAGTNIDRIQILCAKIGFDGLALPSTESSEVKGGSGGGAQSVSCVAGKDVTYASVWLTTTKNQVYFVWGSCVSQRDSQAQIFHFGTPYKANGFWGPGYPTRQFACPPNTAAIGLTVRYGQHVNAVGLICGAIVLQPAPPPVAGPPPGPARPGRYVEYGAPKSGVPRPTAPSFVGSYSLSSRSGRRLTLVVNQGDGNDVFGTLGSTDALFNGQFTGTVEVGGRRFNFTYRDAATGKTGSGTLKYINGEAKAVIGGITSDGPPRVSEIWGGPRQ